VLSGPCVSATPCCLTRTAPRHCPSGPTVTRLILSAARARVSRVPLPATVKRQRRSPSHFPSRPFKRVPPPSPPTLLPSPRRCSHTPLRCARELSLLLLTTGDRLEHCDRFPSTNSIAVPPSPPSPVRTAARTHPSMFLLLSSPLTYPSLSPAYRSMPESSPPSRAALRR
jgi:hypothetical protein